VVETEAPPDDTRLDGREGAEQPAHLVAPPRSGEVVVGRLRVVLDQEVDEAATVLVADGPIEGERRLRVELPHFLELVLRNSGLLLELVERRLVTGTRHDGLR